MTEDFLAVVHAKRFLGREFLTWLVHRIEDGDGRFAWDGQVVELQLGDRVVLAGGPDDRARLTVVGAGDFRTEIGAGLRRGKLVDRAALAIVRGERRWELVVDGGMLTYEGVHAPALGDRDRSAHADPRAGFENDLFLRVADLEEAIGVLDHLFAEFCALRASSRWTADVLPALRAWVATL
jgi:hypothetical protein